MDLFANTLVAQALLPVRFRLGFASLEDHPR